MTAKYGIVTVIYDCIYVIFYIVTISKIHGENVKYFFYREKPI